MIKTFITITLGLHLVIAACKAAGEADREWEENLDKRPNDTRRD